jgi:hypothetical protein
MPSPSNFHVRRRRIQPGDLAVTAGSFSLRAESETPRSYADQDYDYRTDAQSRIQTAKIFVTEQGYELATVTVRNGTRTKPTFVRTSDKVCGTEVAFPSINARCAESAC